MKYLRLILFVVLYVTVLYAQQLERLTRGLVAVPAKDKGIYIGWRLLSTDPSNIKFNVYRNNIKINETPIENSTNFIDINGTINDRYTIKSIINGVEQEASDNVKPWEQIYKTIPLQLPPSGKTPDGVNYSYSPNDASVGDLDGDGEYEIVLKWDPSNSKDNSQSGYTGNVYLDGLELDGTLLWRIDLGKNIRAGAHYTQFIVYDLDGDGKAEVACKTADGSIDGEGNVIGDPNADYRNSSGYILSGPEYLTIFDGLTGKALVTTDYLPPRGDVSSWGDSYGNRVDRFLACVAYLDGKHPSLIMCRGYYTRTVLVAWDYRDRQLKVRWIFDTNNGYPTYTGQGNHNLSVADLDGDGKDEIVYGAMALDDDGKGMWNSGLGHGDALHVSDIDPNRPGLEIWGIHENARVGSALLDGKTGEIIWGTGPADVGRGVSANLDDNYDGMECWGGTDGLRSANNVRVGPTPPSANFVIWWDGDPLRELLDNISIRKYDGNINPTLLVANGCISNNGTKATPSLQADLLGDWREEVIWRTSDNKALRIYTTNIETSYRLVTLMHDRQYRLSIAWQNVGYNQPPHTSFFIGKNTFIPDSLRPPDNPQNIRGFSSGDTVIIQWDANTESDLAGYIVYKGKDRNNFIDSFDVGNKTSFIDTNVVIDSSYYYAVVAYDIDGNKSQLSEIIEITPTIRPLAPQNIDYRYDSNSVLLLWRIQNIEAISKVNIYRSEYSDLKSAQIFSVDKNEISFIDKNLLTGKTYYYSLTVTDTNNVESFHSKILMITPNNYFTFQAEDASTIGTVFIESNHLGYNGTGFTNFDVNNSAVEFTFVPGFSGGLLKLYFRYALGNVDRTGALIVNDVSKNLTMRSTGAWTNYVIDSIDITLNSGYDNTIRFSTTGSDFGNLDEIIISPKPLTSVESKPIIPNKYLIQNYPNPFNPSTIIYYQLPVATNVTLIIYNARGEEVINLVNNEFHNAGSYTVQWNGKDMNGYSVSSGIYFCMMKTNNILISRKMVLLR